MSNQIQLDPFPWSSGDKALEMRLRTIFDLLLPQVSGVLTIPKTADDTQAIEGGQIDLLPAQDIWNKWSIDHYQGYIRITYGGDVQFTIDPVGRFTFGGTVGLGSKGTIYAGMQDGLYVHSTSGNTSTSFGTQRQGTPGYVFFMSCAGSSAGSITHPTTTSTAYNTTSDRRLKTNIQDHHHGLRRIWALKPRTFEFTTEPGVEHTGFIADEVQQVVPLAVTGQPDAVDDKGNPVYQQLDLSKLVPDLVSAVKALTLKTKEQDERIEALEAQLVAAKRGWGRGRSNLDAN